MAEERNYQEFVQAIEQLLRNTNDVVKRRGREILDEFNITPPQFVALQVLTQEGEMTIGELSEKLYLACSTVTDLVDRMEKNSLLERYRDENDRRIVRIRVKEKGHHLISEVIAARQAYLAKTLQDLTEAEQQRLISALQQLNARMDS